jgi:chemotaxis protein MotB
MNRSETEDGRHEIVIVRRGGYDDDDGHHGGVWKIAFADFMTAMMCFFLVMWLINATNEETRTALASYFNPIKLVDQRTSRKGLDDIGDGPKEPTGETKGEAVDNPPSEPVGPVSAAEETPPAAPLHPSDESLFDDPYAVLAEIVADTGRLQNISAEGDGGAQEAGPATGASGGDSYRDPFAPDFWSTQVEAPAANETAQKTVPEGKVAETAPEVQERFAERAGDPFAPGKPAEPRSPEEDERELAELVAAPPPAQVAEAAKQASPETQEIAAEAPPAPSDTGAAESRKTEELAEKIRSQLAAAFGGAAELDGITIEHTDQGVIISVADDMQDGMFEIGSAVPRRDLVLAMEKIGKTLAAHDGNISINGHTDGRPFSRGDYDNWRLSTARAHATYYMLVRGGLEEKRITGVSGFADRKLKRPDDPYASVNRRIEILLGTPG